MRKQRSVSTILFSIALLGGASARADSEWHSQHSRHAHDAHHARPDAYAPVGVMGDHLHPAGEFMLSYRFAHMNMSGNRDGTQDMSPQDVFALGYRVSPTRMDMDAHMLGLMFAPTDWLTLMSMLPVVSLDMRHVTAMGGQFDTSSSGLGDFKLSGLLRLLDHRSEVVHNSAHLNLGMSFPTGSVNEQDFVPMMGKLRLPYPMQIGSGTFDFMPGATYNGSTAAWSWGAQALGVVRVGENRFDYAFGNRVELTSWIAKPLLPWLSASFRVGWNWWGNVRGADATLNPALVPTANPLLRGGNRLDLLPGMNFVVPLGPLGENRLAIEAGFPVYQNLHGPQLETDWRIMVGWQKAFKAFGG